VDGQGDGSRRPGPWPEGCARCAFIAEYVRIGAGPADALRPNLPMRSTAALLVLMALGQSACAAPAGTSASDEPPEFGLGGGKADEGGCDAAAELCWNAEDSWAMRRYLSRQDALLLGVGDAVATGSELVDSLVALSHKLDPDELAALADGQARIAALEGSSDEERAIFVADVHRGVASRIVTAYMSAYAAPLGQSAASGIAGSADGAGDGAGLPEAEGLTEGMRQSLQVLRENGAMGYAYALLLEHTGVLDQPYEPWDETFPFSEPREARAERIIDRAMWASGRSSAIAGVEGLIPYVGIPLSFSHEVVSQFRLRARMTFELAALYGIDIREGDNLLLVVGVMLSAWELPELRALMAGNLGLPIVSWAIIRVGGAIAVRAMIRRLILAAIAQMLTRLGERGAEMAARLAVRAAARSGGRQLLGWITFGAAILGDVLFDGLTTRAIGGHSRIVLEPWGTGMLTERAVWLADSRTRDCAAVALGEVMRADGSSGVAEERLLAGHLSRSFWMGERWTPLAAQSDVRAQARAAAAADPRTHAGVDCLGDRLVGTSREERLSALSWLLTMAAVDGRVGAEERALFDRLADDLRGDAWFGDGAELEPSHLDAVASRVETVFVPQGERAELGEVGLDDLVDQLDRTSPAATEAVRCAFEGC